MPELNRKPRLGFHMSLCHTLLPAALLLSLTLPLRAAEPAGIAEYQAEYEVRYKGRRVADAVFSVTSNADSEFIFRSSTRARGLLRLASPNPATDESRFRLENERLQPVGFHFVDGSRKGEDNFAIAFDRAAGEIRVTRESGVQSLTLENDLLDRGTLQVAIMRDLAACKMPGPYRYVDDDGIAMSQYNRLDDLTAETGIGMLATVRFSQQREGSSRNTVLWLAPDFAFLPVRIEQFRNGELQTAFMLESLAGIERKASTCSGFR